VNRSAAYFSGRFQSWEFGKAKSDGVPLWPAGGGNGQLELAGLGDEDRAARAPGEENFQALRIADVADAPLAVDGELHLAGLAVDDGQD